MANKRSKKKITNPDELDSYLESTTPVTWIVLISVVLCLAGLFVWSFLSKITYKISGLAQIDSGVATLNIEESKLSELKVGQKVYISSVEGEILSINDAGYPTVSSFNTLEDGEYTYDIVLKVIRPIDYFSNK